MRRLRRGSASSWRLHSALRRSAWSCSATSSINRYRSCPVLSPTCSRPAGRRRPSSAPRRRCWPRSRSRPFCCGTATRPITRCPRPCAMSDFLANLGLGFSVALTLQNLGLAFLGCMVGTLIGVLPGVGPIATIAMLLPVTYGFEPVGALIMLAGIYYGAQYGGSTTAILVNIPGEAASVVTTLDGHQMARQGRAGVALGIAAIGSFFAGTVATLIIAG